ncbi:Putative triacylglycerol lipase precursor [Mycobacteroides abscessus subsp. bolletii]|uniref:esterase/lipase family protein n=1 Tax=Mycobacteroides abscessus TaxID=36809 RepID=UPI0009A8E730|nr:alpha/beta fold hydrolase [Mycobacteroides abscessus]SKH43041.1 Putative triacylglycerol lipase precursor [Mycobacteroides abscessus subsp. bolletii]SKH45223.1 Putative triacylglycerol lipase precursor [Mycobacteroides abscessus subsp. bolletii]
MPTASHRARGALRNPAPQHPRAGKLRVLLATSLIASLVVTEGAPTTVQVVSSSPLPGPMTFTVESGFISLTSSSTPLGVDTDSPAVLTITRRATVSLNPGDNGRGLGAVIKSDSLAPATGADKPAPGSIPVVLVHGTAENQKYWDAMTTSLHDAGMKAFTFEYGQTGFQGLIGSIGEKLGLRGFGDVEVSTQQLADEVSHVLNQTGASKVDLVGHSQGGLLIKNFVAQDKSGRVANVVQLAPSSHGTTFSGLADFIGPVGDSVNINGWKPVKDVIYSAASALAWPSLSQQTVGSRFLDKLNTLPDTKPGVDYLVVSTNDDVVATPYKSQFITAAPGSTAVNIEAHSLPGVPRDGVVGHGLNSGEVISAVTNYLKSSQSAQRSPEQVKDNPGTTLTKDGNTTTISEGKDVVATVDNRTDTTPPHPEKQVLQSPGKAATATKVITPSGATLEVTGGDVTLKRGSQSVSISETHGVTVANAPAGQAPDTKKPAQPDHLAKTAEATTTSSPASTETKTHRSPGKPDADNTQVTHENNAITPKIGIGANGISRDGKTAGSRLPSDHSARTATDSGSAKTPKTSAAIKTNGTPATAAETGTHANNSATHTVTPSGSGAPPPSGATGSAAETKAAHTQTGSGSGSGEHTKSSGGTAHEHSAGDS